ncbi:MAG: histidine--tRNA ligase, partial [Bacteroidia bacterium]|nr:histidine--tRNA ligase [Bacteroidia bacterium]
NKIEGSELSSIDSKNLTPKISEKALRYDLTIPFARFVVMNRNEIAFPFKRYQIQPVWRADRPQKGRYREFYQCDVDVIGSNSVLNEVDLIQIIDEVFAELKIPVSIHVNHRKVLDGILAELNLKDNTNAVLIALDKLDKIGLEKVKEELSDRIDSNTIGLLFDKIGAIENGGIDSISAEKGNQGKEELNKIFGQFKGDNKLSKNNDLLFDIKLARGLDYYTGTIIEVKAKDVEMGSICGGGRYDDLTGVFGLKDVSGVGVSFGADRIYDVLSSMDSFKDVKLYSSKVMFVNFGEATLAQINKCMSELRKNDVSCELYPDEAKMKKQFSYANTNNIPYVISVGDEELKSSKAKLKDMNEGTEETIAFDDLVKRFSNG